MFTKLPRWMLVFIGGIFAAIGRPALAQVVVPDPVDLDAVVFPITLDSIASQVALAGGTMIALWAVYKIGFKLVRKFIERMGTTV